VSAIRTAIPVTCPVVFPWGYLVTKINQFRRLPTSLSNMTRTDVAVAALYVALRWKMLRFSCQLSIRARSYAILSWFDTMEGGDSKPSSHPINRSFSLLGELYLKCTPCLSCSPGVLEEQINHDSSVPRHRLGARFSFLLGTKSHQLILSTVVWQGSQRLTL
jgi:hypothetical protein